MKFTYGIDEVLTIEMSWFKEGEERVLMLDWKGTLVFIRLDEDGDPYIPADSLEYLLKWGKETLLNVSS